MSNDQLVIFINFKTSLKSVSNSTNLTAAEILNQIKVSFLPQVSNKSNDSQGFNPFFKPAWIDDISAMGLMTIDFYQGLYVPVFANTGNLTSNANSRKLATGQANMTLP